MNNLKERRIIQKVVKQLIGLPKIEIFDILFKTEQLFTIIEDPSPKTIDSILYSWDNPRDTQCIDGSFYHLVDYTYNLRIYVITYPNTFLSVFRNNYHFKTANCNNPKKFTKRNLIQSFKNTNMEAPLLEFLKKNNVRKRNIKTNRFLIVEYLHDLEIE